MAKSDLGISFVFAPRTVKNKDDVLEMNHKERTYTINGAAGDDWPQWLPKWPPSAPKTRRPSELCADHNPCLDTDLCSLPWNRRPRLTFGWRAKPPLHRVFNASLKTFSMVSRLLCAFSCLLPELLIKSSAFNPSVFLCLFNVWRFIKCA